MKFPVCEFAEAEEGFYSQCASCPIAAGSAGCALSELEDGNYIFEGETHMAALLLCFISATMRVIR